MITVERYNYVNHTSPVEEVLHDSHKGGHLAEDEHTMVGSSELGQHSIEDLKLP
jgi:hypothetical protein